MEVDREQREQKEHREHSKLRVEERASLEIMTNPLFH